MSTFLENIKLCLNITKAYFCIKIFRSMTIKKSVELDIKSNYDQDFELSLTAFVVPIVSSYVPNKFIPINLPDFSEFCLADPNFMLPKKLDLLLGNGYGELLLSSMKKM